MNACRCLIAITSAAFLGLSACRKKADVNAELAALEATFSAATGAVEQADAGIYVNAALAAVRQDDYAGGVLALQTVQQMPAMTAAQLRVVHGAMQTLTHELVERAAKGDLKAKAELAIIERTRSQ